MKKLFLPILLSAILLLFAGCSLFGEQEAFDKKVDIAIDGEPLALSVVYDDIYGLACEYDQNTKLVGVVVTFEGKEQISTKRGTANFTFASKGEENTTAIVVSYDMQGEKVTEISYKQRKKLKVATEPMDEGLLAASFESIFESFSENTSFVKKLDGENVKLTVEFDSEGLTYSLT